jgi:hypothetical protein
LAAASRGLSRRKVLRRQSSHPVVEVEMVPPRPPAEVPPLQGVAKLGMNAEDKAPIKEQQELLQVAAQRVMEFVMRALGLPTQEAGAAGVVSPEASPVASPHSQTTVKSHFTQRSHVTVISPPHTLDLTLMPSLESAAVDALQKLSPLQHQVVGDGFKFLFHVTRENAVMVVNILKPNVKVLRAFASHFPFAMRLLATLTHHSLPLSGLKPADVEAFMLDHVARRHTEGPPQFPIEAVELLQSVVEAKVDADEDRRHHSQRVKIRVLELVQEHLLDNDVFKARLMAEGDGAFVFESLRLIAACTSTLNKLEAEDASSSSATAGETKLDSSSFRDAVSAAVPPARCLLAAADHSLPLPLRAVYSELLTQQFAFHPNRLELLKTFVKACRSDLAGFRRGLDTGEVAIKDLEAVALTPFLLETLPACLLRFLRIELDASLLSSMREAVAGAKRAVERESTKSRLWRSQDILHQKISRAVSQRNHAGLTQWISRVENGAAHALGSASQPSSGSGSKNGSPVSSGAHSPPRSPRPVLRSSQHLVPVLLELVEDLADLVLGSGPWLLTRLASSSDEEAGKLLSLLAFAAQCEHAMPNGAGHTTGFLPEFAKSVGNLSVSAVPDLASSPEDATHASEPRFVQYLSEALVARHVWQRGRTDDEDVLLTQVPNVMDEAQVYVRSAFLAHHPEGRILANCQPSFNFWGSASDGEDQQEQDSCQGSVRDRYTMVFKVRTDATLKVIKASDSILKRVLWRHFSSFMVFNEKGPSERRLGDDFRLWSRYGGVYLEHILLMIRYQVTEDEDCSLFYLDLVSRFLEDNLANIRSEGARYDAHKMIRLVQAEVDATQMKQRALQSLDGHIVLMAIVAMAAQQAPTSVNTRNNSFLWKIIPRVLYFGTRLMATGNKQVQETIMDYHDKAIVEMLVQRKFCVGLRTIMRFCRYQIESLMYSSTITSGQATLEAIVEVEHEGHPTLVLMEALFSFISSLCGGHNLRARTFLREQRLSSDNVNLVAEASALLYTTCSYALSFMTYVQAKAFTTRIAPPVHSSQPKTRRRFLAWHQSPRKFAHLSEVLNVIRGGFNALTEMVQGPCHENQVICERMCEFAAEVLEWCGTVHLELPSPRHPSRVWFGGDPLRFYELYHSELLRLGEEAGEEAEAASIRNAHQQWKRIGERKLFFFQKAGLTGPAGKDILGVGLETFVSVCLRTERSCLKFLTAMLEGQSPGLVDHVRQSIDSLLFFQNMDSLVRTSSSTSRPQLRQQKQESAVLYLTILSTLASLSQDAEAYAEKMTALLDDWQESMSRRPAGGLGHADMLVASVEIIGLDGAVQQVYFAVPQWIKTYWNYPLVQKAKDELTYQVNRDSPEEKILDFYDRMDVLTTMMRRQELLHKVFWVFHGFLGGKSVDIPFMPGPRAVLLMLTIVLNIWLCAQLYFDDMPSSNTRIYDMVSRWTARNQVLYVLEILHLGLALSILVTAALNSGAADAVKGRGIRLGPVWISLDAIVRLVLVLYDVRWLLMLTVLSGLGCFVSLIAYAFCVVDVIPQVGET